MKKFVLALLCSFSFPVMSAEVGETALYLLNRENSSSVIKSGSIITEIKSYDQDLHTYDVHSTCDFKIQFRGDLKGTMLTTLTGGLFDGSLLEQLRSAGSYETENFKIKHLGFERVVTPQGYSYENTDKIYVYDINLPDEELECLGSSLLPQAEPMNVQNLTVTFWITPEIPVLGLARVYITGRTSGVNFKAGLDYVSTYQ